jgi:DNA-binding MarR family transcriptional regulator
VAEAVRRIVMGKINATARQLLREMGYQAEGSPTPDVVVPREAAENLGLDPSSPEYRAALDHLVALGDIEPNPDPALREQGHYRLTRQGRARVRELLRR